jgi:hypothetical protein
LSTPQLESIFGNRPQNYSGTLLLLFISRENIWDEFPDMVDSIIDSKFHQAVEKQETVSFEYFYSPISCFFEMRAHPSYTGLSVFFLDITEKKRIEDALRIVS